MGRYDASYASNLTLAPALQIKSHYLSMTAMHVCNGMLQWRGTTTVGAFQRYKFGGFGTGHQQAWCTKRCTIYCACLLVQQTALRSDQRSPDCGWCPNDQTEPDQHADGAWYNVGNSNHS